MASQGYTRNDENNNIAEGNVIRASDLDGEFNAIQTAFNASAGHTHDGTQGEGGAITDLGPSQDVSITASLISPTNDDTVSIGSSGNEFKDLHIDGKAYIDELGENLLVGDAASVSINFWDTDIAVTSSADGQLDIDADGEVEITVSDADGVIDLNVDVVDISNDVKMSSDAAILNMGADDDVQITHVADTGVLFTAGSSGTDVVEVQFRDSALSIGSSTDGQLDLAADTEIELTTPTVELSNDISLASDSAVIKMGADSEVTVTHVADTGVELKTTGATVNAVTDSLNIQVENASAVAGIGAGITFSAETNASNVETIGAIRSVTTSVTSGNEQADLSFHTMKDGTLTEAFRYVAIDDELYITGNLETTGDVTVGGALDITGSFTADNLSSTTADTDLTLSGNGTGNVNVSDNLIVTGDLTVSGTTTTVNSTTVSIADANFELASNNNNDGSNAITVDTVDFGVYGNYNSDPGSTNATAYAGFFRDASDSGKIKFYSGLATEPTTTVDTTDSGYAEATLVAGSVEVDNLSLDGNAITSTDTDGDITVTPNGEGSAVVSQLKLGSSDVAVSDIKDEDDFTSNSDSALATQQSIKAYVDSATGGISAIPAGTLAPYAGEINIAKSTVDGVINDSTSMTIDTPTTGTVVVGMKVIGAGIPEGVTVSTVTSPTVFVLSQAVTVADGVSVHFHNAPSGWLACYGQTVSATSYATLYSVIGTRYGNGSDSDNDTFELPDLRGRVIAGQDDLDGSASNRLPNDNGETSVTHTTTSLVNASADVPVDSTSGIQLGMRVTGSGISASDKVWVIGINSSTLIITISSAQTISNGVSLTFAFSGQVVGSTGGYSTHTLTSQESGEPGHSHTATQPAHSHTLRRVSGSEGGNSGLQVNYVTNGSSLTNQGGVINNTTPAITVSSVSAADASNAHNILQPTMIMNYIIKY
jgi:microcystin-dependent protein